MTRRRRTFGRVVRVDARDEKYAIRLAKKSARVARTWRTGSRSADQGDTSSCVGHAWAHWLACHPRPQWLDPLGLYDLCKFVDEYRGEDYDGTSVRAGAHVLKRLGYIQKYVWPRTLDALIYQILEVGPVVVGTNWYAGMDTPDESGIIRPRGRSLGGHAWLIYSADTRRELFGLKNSWGPDWGVNGTAKIAFTDFARLLDEDGEVCSAIERKP